MARSVKAGLVQAGIPNGDASRPIDDIKKDMIEKHEALLGKAAKAGAEVVCFQEIFYGPYFPADQDRRPSRSTSGLPTTASSCPTCRRPTHPARCLWPRQFRANRSMRN